ncbi:MAG: NAD-dependent epimerase/dehydratase family protein [Polyangiaceae bacterium]|nr:NAD-dependent epimerase/dehydratase family protein [Polyangiaceae bacterium]
MTVLLSGGSGFLGSHIAEQLSLAGRRVRALVRKSSDTRFLATLPGVELVDASMADRDAIVRAAAGVTAIVHCAGLVKARTEEEYYRVNVGGTENMLAAAVAAAPGLRRFVHVSSLTVAGPSDHQGTPVTADTPPRPLTAYGRSKRAAERVVLAKKDELPVTILRPAAIYGPRDREILAFFKAVQARVLPYFGSTQNRMSMVHGADAGAACIAAIEADVASGAVYFIDDGAVHTMAELIEAVEGALGKRAFLRMPLPEFLVRTVAFGSELYGKATDQAQMLTRDKCNELFRQWVCDGAPARRDLGWEPKIEIREGIRRTAAWYREAGWI